MSAPISFLHLAHLRKSGLSDEMIGSMLIESKSRAELVQLLEHNRISESDTGYIIPYFDRYGKPTPYHNTRLMLGVQDFDKGTGLPAGNAIKYLKPRGTPNLIYWPPGIETLLANHTYCVITEGEKKAAKAVQEGIPCIAIAGVWNWSDMKYRALEKAQGKGVSYQTKPILELQELAGTHGLILLFDSDTETNKNVNTALRLLCDALLFNGAKWVRTLRMRDMLEKKENVENYGPFTAGEKIGLDDLLLLHDGAILLKTAITDALGRESQAITPLAVIPYGSTRNNITLNYIIPNSTPSSARNSHVIFKQVEKLVATTDKTAPPVYTIESTPVARTRIWCSRVISDIDHRQQNLTHYEVAYVPLTQRVPLFKRGTGTILNVHTKDDLFASHGASILKHERAAIEDVLHACQTHAYAQRADGTTRRGWVDFDTNDAHISGFVKPQGIITKAGFFLNERKDCPLLSIPIGSEDAVLSAAMIQRGEAKQGAHLLFTYVLRHPLPALMCAATVAGLLLDKCPDSENFIVHLYGESSGGKTTALRAAASLFGDPKKLIRQWRTTENGLEAALLARNDLAIFLDETGQQKNQEVLNSSAYLIANGGQKSRASRDGSEREVRSFRVIALSTGEQTLLRGPISGGQETRVLQVPADLLGSLWGETTGEQIEWLSSGLNANCGWALEPLVTSILNRSNDPTKKSFSEEMATCIQAYRRTLPKDAPDIVRRRAKHYALISVALKLLLEVCLELLEERNPNILIRSHMTAFFKHVQTKMLVLPSDQYQNGENLALVPHFYEQLEININRICGFDNRKVLGDVWGHKNGDLVGIICSKFEEMAGPWGSTRMLAALDAANVLIYTPVEAKRYGKKHSMKIEGAKSLKMYVVSYKKLIAFANGE